MIYSIKNSYFWMLLILGAIACQNDTSEQNKTVEEPMMTSQEKFKSANIYEVNIRQYTEAGTFNAFATHLPRLKDMGVDILWLMPINPISDTNKKGTLGSYYAVSDYKKVNPEFGTPEDFQSLVDQAHELGMYIIIDWVPNHTGWDHVWIKEHPEYYTQDEEGNIIDPVNPNPDEDPWDWTDVADLNYDNTDMRDSMIEAFVFWLEEYGIDGYRCDVAHQVPNDFWKDCIDKLKEVKPDVFMLAEAEIAEQVNESGFDMCYGWEFHHIMNKIAKGEETAEAIDEYLEKSNEEYKKGYKMHFTSNHDENSWADTEMGRMGDGHQTFAVLASTFDGMPLVYSGQEEPLDRKLLFFEKDDIGFKDYAYADFYKTLLEAKKRNKALWNGAAGGELQRLKTGNDEAVYAFMREKEGDKVVVVLNLTAEEQAITLEGDAFVGDYKNIFTDAPTATLEAGDTRTLKPWQYFVFSNK